MATAGRIDNDYSAKSSNQQYIAQRATGGQTDGEYAPRSDHVQQIDRTGPSMGYVQNEYPPQSDDTQVFNKVPVHVEDASGKSESSEGIVDHNPFNRAQDILGRGFARQAITKLLAGAQPTAAQPGGQQVRQPDKHATVI